MQPLDRDMDELFRRAAENYPLDTSGANWSAVESALQQPYVPEKKSDRRKLLWLLLLIPFSFVCNHFITDAGLVDPNEVVGDVAKNEKANTNDNTGTTDYRPSATAPAQPAEQLKTPENPGNNGRPATGANASGTGSENAANPTVNTHGASGMRSQTSVSKARNNRRSDHVQASANNTLQRGAETRGLTKTITQAATIEKRNEEVLPTPSSVAQVKANSEHRRAVEAFPLPDHSVAFSFEFSPEPQNIVSVIPKTKQAESQKWKRFYAGLMGGVEATSIKMQKVEKASYDIGILLGYSFHPRWSVEAGIFHDKKFYYSKGEYFSKAKIYMPPNSTVAEVDGNCSMWELPVGIRYSFGQKQKHAWFSRVAVSTFFMKEEAYTFDYYYPATGTTYPYRKTYEDYSKHFLAILQLSAGYTRQIGRAGELRIEPYFNLPLRKVGIGELPLQGAGLHVGFTRRLF
jgi:hypothetical protein